MKVLHLLAVISVVGLKFAAAVTCENESDPDSGYAGNWCGCSDGTCWDLSPSYPHGCNPHGPYQIACP